MDDHAVLRLAVCGLGDLKAGQGDLQGQHNRLDYRKELGRPLRACLPEKVRPTDQGIPQSLVKRLFQSS